MFRELTKKKKAITREECIRLLTEEKRGVLSVQGDDGYPYGMPMNHLYNPDDGCIYFHCGDLRVSHRADALARSPKVSFCVYDSGYRNEGEWALNIKSVIVFGRAELIGEHETTARMTEMLCRKFTSDDGYIKHEIDSYLKETLLIKLTPEHMTGKLVSES